MITKDVVLEFMRPLQVIALIKEYRTMTGYSLKVSKDNVEAALEVGLTDEQVDKQDLDKYEFRRNSDNYSQCQLAIREQQMLRLFRVSDEDIQKAKMDAEVEYETRMKNALAFAIDNWKILGFKSASESVRSIILNFTLD